MTKHVMIASALSQIGEYTTSSAAAGGFDRDDAHFGRTAVRVDEEGFAALADAAQTWRRQVAEIEAAAAKRLKATGEPALDAGVVVLLFEALRFADADADGDGSGRRRRSRRAVDGASAG
jgi:hypothetical protein